MADARRRASRLAGGRRGGALLRISCAHAANCPRRSKSPQSLPDVQFVLDHIGKPPIADGACDEWADLVTRLAAHPNVSCKLSGLVGEAKPGATTADFVPYVDRIIESFGTDRVMFGSDWPVCLALPVVRRRVRARSRTAARLVVVGACCRFRPERYRRVRARMSCARTGASRRCRPRAAVRVGRWHGVEHRVGHVRYRRRVLRARRYRTGARGIGGRSIRTYGRGR